MSLNKDYLISFFLSLAFWISILFVFNLSLKAPKPKEPTILILKAPEIIKENKAIKMPKSIPKPIKTPASQPKNITYPTSTNTPKPSNSSKPKNQSLPNNINIPSTPKSTNNNPPIPEIPKSQVQSPPKTSSNTSKGGDYFKNAYTPPKALYNPKPHIPQNLLPNTNELVLKVKFYIKDDGSCKAILLTPTPNPELNALLQRELSNWKFFPATKNQKPINSTLNMDIRIRIE